MPGGPAHKSVVRVVHGQNNVCATTLRYEKGNMDGHDSCLANDRDTVSLELVIGCNVCSTLAHNIGILWPDLPDQ